MSHRFVRPAALFFLAMAFCTGASSAYADEAPAVTPVALPSLEGEWTLVAVLGNDRSALENKGALDIDWATAGARFKTLFEDSNELHAEFVGAPFSNRSGVAGGSLTMTDPAQGTLQLSSKAPAPMLRTLERLDAGLLPHAFVLAERKDEAQFVFVRGETTDPSALEHLIAQASERATLQVAATVWDP